MNFVKKGIVLNRGSSGEIDYYLCGDASVVWFNGKFYMYYTARYDTSYFATALAISKDGMNFIKKGIVLPVSNVGDIDEERASRPCALVFNNKVYLYYIANDGVDYRSALAISKDGVNFIKKGVVIDFGDVIDSSRIGEGISVIRYNNKFYAYYIAGDPDTSRVALAISKDGMNFIKKGVVIDVGATGEIDSFIYGPLSAVVINNLIYVYYQSYDGTYFRAALAISKDGVNFIKKGVVIDVGATGEIDDDGVFSPHVVCVNNKKYIYYKCDSWDIGDTAFAISSN